VKQFTLGAGVKLPKLRIDYSFAQFSGSEDNVLTKGMTNGSQVWMSHGDTIKTIPSNYKIIGSKELYTEDTKTFTSNANLELGLDLGLALDKELLVVESPKLAKEEYDRCQSALDLINNIYFDLDKSFIRPDAASELDKVIKIMKRCQNISVEASSHTDSRASDQYNEELSQRRAQSTVDYITQVGGIDHSRIRAVGYGETRLRNRCSDGVKCSEIEHQMNRRTQFDVSNY